MTVVFGDVKMLQKFEQYHRHESLGEQTGDLKVRGQGLSPRIKT